MAKKTTFEEIGQMLTHVVEHMATKEEIADIRKNMVTKDQVIALHTQVNSIERQLRETKTEIRLADLEEKVFGETRR